MIFTGSGFNSSARFFGILPPRIRQILTNERLPQTMQTSCGLSLTTSHSAHNTACCSATAFRGWLAASKLSAFDWFITGPWEEVLHTEHFAGDCQGVRMAHVGHSVILCLFSTTRVSDPGRRSQTHKRKTICIPRLLRIADKCLIADLEAFIAIYLKAECFFIMH